MKPRKYLDRAGQWGSEPTKPRAFDLMPYQREGLKWLSTRTNSLLADDMGLGKTCQAVSLIDTLPEAARVLIICPAGLRFNWLRELALWLTTTRRCQIAKKYLPGLPVVIVQYDALAKLEAQIRAVEWDLVICDEVHAIKNAFSTKARQVLGDGQILPIRAKRKVLLTGTPMLARPIELWTILKFLGLAMPRDEFGKRFCGGGNFQGASNADELAAMLAPMMLRRMKRDVLTDLPAKSRYVVRLAPSGQMAGLIRSEKSFEQQAGEVQKFKGGVSLAEISKVRASLAMAKVEMPVVQSILTEAVECHKKVVIFVYHNEVAKKVASLFPGKCVVYTGSQSGEERQRAVDKFQTSADCQVFIGTIGAAGVGITLTAASHVIFLELDWTPAMLAQAEDRCWRNGQKNAVTVQYLVVDGSIDAHQLDLTLSKQETINSIL